MSDKKPLNRICVVTGQQYEPGDYIIKGEYIVKASVDYTPELREATEAGLRGNVVIGDAPMTDIVRGKRNTVNLDLPPVESERRDGT